MSGGCKWKVKLLSLVQLLETSWTVAYQASPSMGFSRQEYWRLWRPHQTYSHNLHFKITGLSRRLFPETVLKQDTLLLYNPKECRGKKVCPFFLLENSRPLSPWGPLDLSTCLGNDSLTSLKDRCGSSLCSWFRDTVSFLAFFPPGNMAFCKNH